MHQHLNHIDILDGYMLGAYNPIYTTFFININNPNPLLLLIIKSFYKLKSS